MKEEKSKDENAQEPERFSEPFEFYYPKPDMSMRDFYGPIVISSFGEMEEKTRDFSRNLTPVQRLEYLMILNEVCYGEILSTNREQLWDKEIIVTIPQ